MIRCMVVATKARALEVKAALNKVFNLPLTGVSAGKGIHMNPADCRTTEWTYEQELKDGTWAIYFDDAAVAKLAQVKAEVKTFAAPNLTTKSEETDYKIPSADTKVAAESGVK